MKTAFEIWLMVTPLDLCQNVLAFQFHYLQGYYQALLITGVALLTVVEVVRLYLGYAGNLRKKVIQSSPLVCVFDRPLSTTREGSA